MEPIFLKPNLQDKIWGGEKLSTEFGFNIPSKSTGEAWVISSHKNGMSYITYPEEYKGISLEEFYKNNPVFFGNEKKEKFPLLIKIIDAKEKLSVQVHPQDEYAKNNGENGKEECWYIIDAGEDSHIIYGHNAKNKDEIIKAIENNDIEKIMIKRKVKKGDFIFVPAGTVHAIGEDIMILETQQNSDTTYRLYDYDRVDSNGNKRNLHIKESIDVINIPDKDIKLKFKEEKQNNSKIIKFLEEKYFNVSKWEINGKFDVKLQLNYTLCTVIDGKASMKVKDKAYEIVKGDSFILPSDSGNIELNGKTEIIVSNSKE